VAVYRTDLRALALSPEGDALCRPEAALTKCVSQCGQYPREMYIALQPKPTALSAPAPFCPGAAACVKQVR
jgi:hypothetical protein